MLKQIYNKLNGTVQNGQIGVIPAGVSFSQVTLANNFEIGTELAYTDALDVLNFDWAGLQIANTGEQALASFAVQVKFAAAGDWITLFDQAGDFNSPPYGSAVKGASHDLTALAAGVNGWLNLDVTYYAQIRLAVTCVNSFNTALNVFAGAKAKVNFEEVP